MKKYKTLLFDADDTLLDFSANEHVALHSLFADHHMVLTDEIEANYKKINVQLWQAFEEGNLEIHEVVTKRFTKLFKQYGKEADGVALEKQYRSYLKQGHQMLDGALELIRNLHTEFDLYIVTNGDPEVQYHRLNDSGLYPYFKDIFVSADVGFQKPMKEFFDHVFARVEDFALEHTLIIGDSLSSDMTGGKNAGIDTCWINPNNKKNHTNIVPTYEIRKLNELSKILNIHQNSFL